MADVVKFPEITSEIPTKQSMSFRSKLKDALLDVRLALSLKKISSNVILKSELKAILDSTKEEAKDEQVASAIDDVFKDYFKVEMKKDNSSENVALSIDNVQKMIDDNANYQESKEENGRSYVKTDSHYKTSVDSETNKAA